MRNSKLMHCAFLRLTDTQKKLFNLLVSQDVRVEEVHSFIDNYDIDNETAVTTFYLNDLLDKYSIADDEIDVIPRVRGLEQYFHFQNTASMLNVLPGELVLDPDVFLKIRYAESTRPFILTSGFVSGRTISKLVGKRYYRNLKDNARVVKTCNREYVIPRDSNIADLLCLNLQISLNQFSNPDKIFCYMYDVFRYGNNGNCSLKILWAMQYSKIRKTIKRLLYGN